jgi:hypothetical protein
MRNRHMSSDGGARVRRFLAGMVFALMVEKRSKR